MKNHPSITCHQNIVFIIIWNVAGELVSPKNMTVGSKRLDVNVVISPVNVELGK